METIINIKSYLCGIYGPAIVLMTLMSIIILTIIYRKYGSYRIIVKDFSVGIRYVPQKFGLFGWAHLHHADKNGIALFLDKRIVFVEERECIDYINLLMYKREFNKKS